ncbi:MAG TPA: glycosyltransferase, partial [Thermomicrobiales bacterium]
MREIAIVASGSRGDVQPYIALGKGLQTVGYHVRLLTSDNFAPLVTEAGLTFCSTGTSVEELLQSPEWRKTIDSGNFLTILARMRTEMRRGAAETARRLPALLRGSDLIITGMGGLTGVSAIAEMLGIPVVEAYLFPFTPTRAFP